MRTIFVSHHIKDKQLATELVDLIKTFFGADQEILCTSVPGHQLPPGSNIAEELKKRIGESPVVFALLTETSVVSQWLPYELGAAWVAGKDIVPLVGPRLGYEDLPGPLKAMNCIRVEDEDAELRLIDAFQGVGRVLGMEVASGPVQISKTKSFLNRARSSDWDRIPDDWVPVDFVCTDPDARHAEEVYVAGSFNSWLRAREGRIKPDARYRLEKVIEKDSVVWRKTLPIPPGPHDFKFVVGTNQWVAWTPDSKYRQGNTAPGGSNFRVTAEPRG